MRDWLMDEVILYVALGLFVLLSLAGSGSRGA